VKIRLLTTLSGCLLFLELFTPAVLADPISLVSGVSISLYADIPSRRIYDIAVSPAGTVAIASPASGTIEAVAQDGGLTPVLNGLESPIALTYDSLGTLYVGDSGLYRYSEGTLELLVPGFPGNLRSLSANPDGLLYAFGSYGIGTSSIWTVDSSGQLRQFATGFDDIAGISVGPDGSVFVADDENWAVLRVSPDGGSTSVFAEQILALDVAVSPDGQYVFVADASDADGRIQRYDMFGNSLTIASGIRSPSGLGFAPNGDLFVTSWPHGIYQLSGDLQGVPIPEPATISLLAIGLVMIGIARSQRHPR